MIVLHSLPYNLQISVSLGSFLRFIIFLYCVIFPCLWCCSILLRFGHLKKQPPLPIFTDQLCTGRDLHQSAQLEILGMSQTFSGDGVFAGFVHIVSQLEKSACYLLKKGFVISCSLWCLTLVLQFLWYFQQSLSCSHCPRPPQAQSMKDPLQCSESTETVTSSQGIPLIGWNIDVCFISLLLKEKLRVDIFSHLCQPSLQQESGMTLVSTFLGLAIPPKELSQKTTCFL